MGADLPLRINLIGTHDGLLVTYLGLIQCRAKLGLRERAHQQSVDPSRVLHNDFACKDGCWTESQTTWHAVQERAGSFSTSAKVPPRLFGVIGPSAVLIYKQHLVTIVGHIGASHETFGQCETGAFAMEGGSGGLFPTPRRGPRSEV